MLAVLRTKRRRQQQSKQFVVTPERLDETLITSESFYAVRAASPAQAASVELTNRDTPTSSLPQRQHCRHPRAIR